MKNQTKISDVYQIVTDRVIELLEKGTVPWQKTWTVDPSTGLGQLPTNLVSKKVYRGVNVWLLSAAGYSSPYWLTYNQAASLGGNVRKGEQSTLVVFWKRFEVKDKKTDEKKFIPLLRYYRVFNVEQCEGIKVPKAPKAKKGRKFNPVAAAEKIVAEMPSRPQVNHGGDRAYYSPALDVVGMPTKESFVTEAAYYSTLFHELTHATGHADRVGRFAGCTESDKSFGSESYATEELVAEMGANFLNAHAGILEGVVNNSAAYIKSWLKKLRDDNKLVVQAAAAAHKAADFILNVTYDQPAA